jgi:hypothetical protein
VSLKEDRTRYRRVEGRELGEVRYLSKSLIFYSPELNKFGRGTDSTYNKKIYILNFQLYPNDIIYLNLINVIHNCQFI